MRFARNVQFQIKTGKEREFTALFEKDVLPLLRKQNGFQEYVSLLNPKGFSGTSLWDDKKSADAYQADAYPQVLAKLTTVIEGTPRVENFETASKYARVA